MKIGKWSVGVVSPKVGSMVLLNVIAMLYGSSIPVVKQGAAGRSAVFSLVRFGVTAAAFVPFAVGHGRECGAAGVELGLWAGGGYVMQAAGLATSGAGRAAFLSMLTLLVVPFLDGLFFLGGLSRVPPLTWLGALLCLLGVAFLESTGSPPCVGDLMNVVSAVMFGVHMLRTQHIARSSKGHQFLPLMGYQMCVVAVMSGGWCMLQQEGEWDTKRLFAGFPWMAALYTGIFTTGLCTWAEMAAMRWVSATEAAIIYGMEPVWGSAFAWLMLAETWDPPACLGAALVLAGTLTVQIFAQHNDDIAPAEIALSASPELVVSSSKTNNNDSQSST